MSLIMPQRGLATAQGFVNASQPSPLVDEQTERKVAFAKIGKYLEFVELAYNDILVLKYIPEKIGSLVASSETQNEQRWQNKCGLVLKYGPTAKDDGFKYEIGDWVYYRASDGYEVGLRCEKDPRIAMCLILSPAHVIGKIGNPDLIY